MLEHAGRYDPVECAGDGSIVFLLRGADRAALNCSFDKGIPHTFARHWRAW